MSYIDSKKKFRKIPSLTLEKSKNCKKTQKKMKIIKKLERIRFFGILDDSKTGSRSSSTSSVDFMPYFMHFEHFIAEKNAHCQSMKHMHIDSKFSLVDSFKPMGIIVL
jgi:hypothetical protein